MRLSLKKAPLASRPAIKGKMPQQYTTVNGKARPVTAKPVASPVRPTATGSATPVAAPAAGPLGTLKTDVGPGGAGVGSGSLPTVPLTEQEQARKDLTTSANQIQAAIQSGGAGAQAGLANAFGKIDTSGQFSAGTHTAPTVAQAVAQYAPGVAAGQNTSGFTSLGATPQAVTSNRPAAFANFGLGGEQVANPTKVGTGAGQAADALGPAPRVDQGLADRQLGDYQEALGMSREVIDRLLNGPSTAKAIGARSLENQLAVARSARGGPGAVQDALNQAQQQAPELQAQAAQQAQQEELARVGAAGNVASNFAQAALGARGQDVDIAKKNVDSGLAVKNMVTQLTGTQLELDQKNQELLGQMARDMAATQFDWASLDATQQSHYLDLYMQQYGIDQNIAAQIKLAQQSGKMSFKDWVNAGVGVLAAGAGVTAAAVGGK